MYSRIGSEESGFLIRGKRFVGFHLNAGANQTAAEWHASNFHSCRFDSDFVPECIYFQHCVVVELLSDSILNSIHVEIFSSMS